MNSYGKYYGWPSLCNLNLISTSRFGSWSSKLSPILTITPVKMTVHFVYLLISFLLDKNLSHQSTAALESIAFLICWFTHHHGDHRSFQVYGDDWYPPLARHLSWLSIVKRNLRHPQQLVMTVLHVHSLRNGNSQLIAELSQMRSATWTLSSSFESSPPKLIAITQVWLQGSSRSGLEHSHSHTFGFCPVTSWYPEKRWEDILRPHYGRYQNEWNRFR